MWQLIFECAERFLPFMLLFLFSLAEQQISRLREQNNALQARVDDLERVRNDAPEDEPASVLPFPGLRSYD